MLCILLTYCFYSISFISVLRVRLICAIEMRLTYLVLKTNHPTCLIWGPLILGS